MTKAWALDFEYSGGGMLAMADAVAHDPNLIPRAIMMWLISSEDPVGTAAHGLSRTLAHARSHTQPRTRSVAVEGTWLKLPTQPTGAPNARR